ncbi:MAG: GNAT family N-acetyltransferase [Actinomycetota bacterium]|nr:GNAT family N-acetyltransferase [Actinomycetota bacterium]
MTGARSLSISEDRIRVLPWRGDPHLAYLVARRGRPTEGMLLSCLADLRGRYAGVLTAALPPEEQGPYLRTGFAVHERLHLLRRPVEPLPDVGPTAGHLARGRRRDRPKVLAIDAAAFPDFWRLDAVGLEDALAATPSVRFRVATTDGAGPAGYAVTGRAGSRGYLQRLAVHPDQQGQGIGSALVVDGMRWLRRWGAREVLVNTQEDNAGALSLYERLGFEREPDGLAVLRRELEVADP